MTRKPQPLPDYFTSEEAWALAAAAPSYRGLFWREVVGVFLGFSRHGKDRLRGFPKLTLDNPVDRGKRVRRDSRAETKRLVAENRGFRK